MTIAIAPDTRVRIHQAFRCCPYAGAVTSRLHAWALANGCVLDDAATLHIVNTCGSDARQAAMTTDALAAIHAAGGPDTRVIVTGCLVAIDPAVVRAGLAPFAQSARFEPRRLNELDDVLTTRAVRFDDVHVTEARYSGNALAQGWTHVVTGTGCLGTCSFCAIRRATGRPKSRPIDVLVEEVARAGDVLLISQDLAAWGTDRGQSVVDLLRALVEAPGDRLYAIESFEPTLFLAHFDALRPILTSGRFSMVAVPIQSASRRVLRTMDRSYDPEPVIEAVSVLRRAGVVVRTDILFGFGDEADDEFEASLRASRAFDLPSFNLYQPRPGTPLLTLPDDVLRDRRDRALAELHTRAQAGVPEIRRSGVSGSRSAPPSTKAENAAIEPARPWDRPAGRAWITAAAAVPLGSGIVSEAGGDALVVTATRSGITLRVAVRPADWPGEAAVRTARHAFAVLAEGTLEPATDALFKELVVGIGAALGADR